MITKLPARIQVQELVSSRYGAGYAGTGYAGAGYAGTGYAGAGYAGTGYAGAGYDGGGYAPPETLDDGLPRPLSWDERVSGSDVVKTQEGLTLKLQSSAQQTPPQPGWVLVLTGGSAEAGYDWTLYGLPRKH